MPLPSRQYSFSRRTLLVPLTLNHSANTSLVPLPSRQCPFSRRTLLVPFSQNHSANTSLVPLPSRQCSSSRRTLLVPFTLNHSANTSPCHCRLDSAPSHDVPCSFPLRRTIPRTPLSCHCRLGSALSHDVPCSFPLRRTIPRTGAFTVSARRSTAPGAFSPKAISTLWSPGPMATSHPPRISPDVLPPQAANGPTRLRFDLLRARASPLQARSASKWIRRFPRALPRRSRLWSAGTCSRFLAYSRPQTTQFAHLGLPSPASVTSPVYPCSALVSSVAFHPTTAAPNSGLLRVFLPWRLCVKRFFRFWVQTAAK